MSTHYISRFFDAADVILGTPVGLMDPMLKEKKFDVAFLDEAGQCIEPFAWLVLEKANRAILSGDHLQLPPTIISEEADRKSTRLHSSHVRISYAVFCLKKKKNNNHTCLL